MKNLKSLLKAKFPKVTCVYTHARSFHADEVFSIALMRVLGGRFVVKRISDEELDASVIEDIGSGRAIAVDIGRRDCPTEGFFDHHGWVSTRRDGTKYASFGLLVKHLEICNEDGFETFDFTFVKSLDMVDNGEGRERNQLSSIIASFNPNWDEDQSKDAIDEAFEDAVRFAEQILKKEFERRCSRTRGEALVAPLVRDAINKGLNYLYLEDKYIPWQKVVVGTSILSVVFPMEDGWGVRLVPKTGGSRYTVARFDRDVQVGSLGVLFIHNTGYLARCETREEAINIARNHVH